MLTVTNAAGEAVKTLAAQQGQPETGGLRVVVQTEQDSAAQLALSVAAGPQEGDQVVGNDEGARVFLEPQAAEFLDDKVLDVQQDEQGRLNFAVLLQPQ